MNNIPEDAISTVIQPVSEAQRTANKARKRRQYFDASARRITGGRVNPETNQIEGGEVTMIKPQRSLTKDEFDAINKEESARTETALQQMAASQL